MTKLADVDWARPLISEVNRHGLRKENKGLLFNLRFAFALHQAAIEPEYEISGENGSRIDFGFEYAGKYFRTELMRLEETDAVKAATRSFTDEQGTEGVIMRLQSNPDDPRQSPAAESLKAVERIIQKCERDGEPNKFPEVGDALHFLLVDFRTFLDDRSDHDRIRVGMGSEYVPYGQKMPLNGQPIIGVFNKNNRLRGARYVRERVHFLGFVEEKEFSEGKFGASIRFLANPQFFSTAEDEISALESWPLRRDGLINWRKLGV